MRSFPIPIPMGPAGHTFTDNTEPLVERVSAWLGETAPVERDDERLRLIGVAAGPALRRRCSAPHQSPIGAAVTSK